MRSTKNVTVFFSLLRPVFSDGPFRSDNFNYFTCASIHLNCDISPVFNCVSSAQYSLHFFEKNRCFCPITTLTWITEKTCRHSHRTNIEWLHSVQHICMCRDAEREYEELLHRTEVTRGHFVHNIVWIFSLLLSPSSNLCTTKCEINWMVWPRENGQSNNSVRTTLTPRRQQQQTVKTMPIDSQ